MTPVTTKPRGTRIVAVGGVALPIVGGAFVAALALFTALGLAGGLWVLCAIALCWVLWEAAKDAKQADEELARREDARLAEEARLDKQLRAWTNADQVRRRIRRAEDFGDTAA